MKKITFEGLKKVEKIKLISGVRYNGNYAVSDNYFTKKVTLFILTEMDKKGYDFVGEDFTQMVFHRRAKGGK